MRNSRCGAERISVLAKTHGLLRSGFSALTMTRIGVERIIRTNLLSRIRTDLPEIVTERIGSDIRSWKCHGLSRSGYPPSKNSRIFAERISVKRIFHGADYLTPWDLSTVHRSNNPLNINGYPRIVDGYPRTSTMKGDNNETMMTNNTSSSASTTDSVASVKMEEARYSYSYCCTRYEKMGIVPGYFIFRYFSLPSTSTEMVLRST